MGSDIHFESRLEFWALEFGEGLGLRFWAVSASYIDKFDENKLKSFKFHLLAGTFDWKPAKGAESVWNGPELAFLQYTL